MLMMNENMKYTKTIYGLFIFRKGEKLMAEQIEDLGKVRSTPKGEYNPNAEYEIMDKVYLNGKSYESLKPVPIGVQIGNTEYWVLSSDSEVALNDVEVRMTVLEQALSDMQNTIGSNNGLAQLDSNGKLVAGQVPTDIRSHMADADIHFTTAERQKLNKLYDFIFCEGMTSSTLESRFNLTSFYTDVDIEDTVPEFPVINPWDVNNNVGDVPILDDSGSYDNGNNDMPD